MNFNTLVKEAHGCRMPVVVSTYVCTLANHLVFDAYLPEWDVAIRVAMPRMAVACGVAAQGKPIDPSMPWEHAEARLAEFRVRPQDALASALISQDLQSESVRSHLKSRFGPMLGKAQELAESWWQELADSSQRAERPS